jgi:hypothetical protein
VFGAVSGVSRQEQDAGEEFDAVCEQIVGLMNDFQVRRRSFEQIPPDDQLELLGGLMFLRTEFGRWVAEIDAKLTAILNAKVEDDD